MSNLPFTDPHTVLGVHRTATREEVKAAFRRAALACHPDVDPSPTAAARFAQVKAAADVLLKGHQPPAVHGPHSWSPAAAAAAAEHARAAGTAVPRNRTAALWAGLLVACGLAFGYGYGWAWYVQSKTGGGTSADGDARTLNPVAVMQRRKLLQALHQDARHRQATAAAASGDGGGGSSSAGGGGRSSSAGGGGSEGG